MESLSACLTGDFAEVESSVDESCFKDESPVFYVRSRVILQSHGKALYPENQGTAPRSTRKID